MVIGLVAGACGRSDSDKASETPTGGATETTAAGNEACEGVTLEATDTGVTAETITIQVMADTGSPLAPGLFQGNVDALKGFEEYINANGGIGCRDLKVEEWDSKLTPEESKNGQINACATALAMVGGNSLFNPDVTEMETCADAAGAATGIPDIAALANDVNEQCSKNAFIIQGIAEDCPEGGGVPTGQRDLVAFVGATKYYETLASPLKGLFMVPGDLPTTVQSATYQIEGQAEAGVDWIGAVKVSGRAEQSAYTPFVQQVRNGNGNYVYNGSNDVAMTNMRREAAAQNLDSVEVWACSLACYTDKFKGAGADVDGTYTWMQFLPFEDAGSNQELDNYLAAVDVPDSFGAQAWMAAVLFQDAVNDIVEADGPNAITRASLLEALNGIDSFDAHGWMGAKSPKGGFSDCMVIVKVENGEFVRATPAEKGTLDCNPEYLTTVNIDPAVEAAKIQ
jgi:ABC-type branched-subunit amino acid transport system substrate-binding protein